jgi:CDGSH-type Zn-finger protein
MGDKLNEPTGSADSSKVNVEVRKNGPVVVDGSVLFNNGTGTVEAKRLFLCRCGHSQKSPLCDGSHKSNGFLADGVEPPQRA